MLLAADAEANIANAEGRTPLHLAAGSHDNPGGVAALLAAGADPCIRDGQGFIPYSVAAEGGRIHRALSRAGGYDRACDEQGEAVSLDSDEQRRIQSALAARGFDPGPADGKFGPRTRRAIQAWQRANGYSATGDLTREQAEMLLTESVVADEVSPKCTGAAKGDKCWKRVADRPGCHVWVTHFHPGQTVSWSGPCSAGIAEGRGELVWTTDGNSVQQTGTLSNGRKHGDWVLSYNGGNENVACVVPELKQGYETDRRFALEGPFENGKAQGQWTVRGCLVVQYDSGQQYLPY
ncbi:MAG: peptidoglycan-binding protein, partial [Gemmatimonadetes bacterium]|nr:peptidoglycan-binding protein [Gemmatimonadota bacterium]